MIRSFIFTFIFFLSVSSKGLATVKLPALITSHMVLQQQAKVKLWGKANALSNLTITTSWDQKIYKTKASPNGDFEAEVVTPKAGGPYNIVFNDGQVTKLSDILIGEVWICSGQSNMEMPMRGFPSQPILNSNEIIADAQNPLLRLFKVERATNLKRQDDCSGEWKEANAETVRDFSALAYQYGAILQKKLKVPVGLILSVVGGTRVETWMDAKTLSNFPELEIPKTLENVKDPHKLPTTLYNGMIAPLTKTTIKGFIWYQGESNRHAPEQYVKLFPKMVQSWRKEWEAGDLPFYYVQIAPFGSAAETFKGPRLREAQLQAMAVIPNSGMVSAIDVGMKKYVHFMDKTTLAKRLSYWALAKTYGIKGIAYCGPILKTLKVEGKKAILSFDFAEYGITSFGEPLTLFEIAGEDQIFYPAIAVINGTGIELENNNVLKPVAVRYAFKEYVKGELYNNAGLPASSFRTDKWTFKD